MDAIKLTTGSATYSDSRVVIMSRTRHIPRPSLMRAREENALMKPINYVNEGVVVFRSDLG